MIVYVYTVHFSKIVNLKRTFEHLWDLFCFEWILLVKILLLYFNNLCVMLYHVFSNHLEILQKYLELFIYYYFLLSAQCTPYFLHVYVWVCGHTYLIFHMSAMISTPFQLRSPQSEPHPSTSSSSVPWRVAAYYIKSKMRILMTTNCPRLPLLHLAPRPDPMSIVRLFVCLLSLFICHCLA